MSTPNNDFAFKHGMSKSPEHEAWRQMRQRCNNPNNPKYRYYGGRGIRVCKSWDSFQSFYEDIGPRPSDAHSLDRIDTNKGYEPSNCRWATVEEQNNNRTNCKYVEYNGHRLSISQWAIKLGIKESTLRNRIRRGMALNKALSPNLY